jgi:lactate dehydrogenase-like 2-hydroxyacid dehydrogenase
VPWHQRRVRCVAAAVDPPDELAHLPRVKIIACATAGYDGIDLAALKDAGIALTNTSAALFDDVADTALMLTLATRRHLIAAHDHVRSGNWGRNGPYPLLSAIRGKKAGILGLGTIGEAIAERFKPLGLEIGYCNRRPKDCPYRYFESAVSLAAWADILVVVIPGGPDTDGLVAKDVLEALGPEGTLINVARGSVVDETALIAALAHGQLASAGLDVFSSEPDPDPRLTSLPNVTLYPHHSSGTVAMRDAMAQLVVDNLAAHFAGRPLLTPV